MSAFFQQQASPGTTGIAALGAVTSLTTSVATFASPTIDGSLLLCVCTGYTRSIKTGSGIGPSPIPTIDAPVTTGYSGPAWTLVDHAGSDLDYLNNGAEASAVAVYFIANAPSMSTSAQTTVSESNAGYTYLDSFGGSCQLYEVRGIALSSPLDASAIGFGAGEISPTTPGTAPLATSSTDFIFVAASCENSPTNFGAGSAYTLVNYTEIGNIQYILNEVAGSVNTDFDPDTGDQLSWACVAAAFAVDEAESGSSITLTFTNATDTGDYYVN